MNIFYFQRYFSLLRSHSEQKGNQMQEVNPKFIGFAQTWELKMGISFDRLTGVMN